MEDIVKNSLRAGVYSTRSPAFPLICKYCKAKAFEIMWSCSADIIQHLNNDDEAWRAGGGAQKLDFLLNMNAAKDGFAEALVLLTTRLIKEQWFVAPTQNRALRRLVSLCEVKKIDPHLLLLFKWSNRQGEGTDPVGSLLAALKNTAGTEDDCAEWFACVETLLGLMHSLIDAQHLGEQPMNCNALLIKCAVSLANRYRQQPYPLRVACLEDVFTTFTVLEYIPEECKKIFQRELRSMSLERTQIPRALDELEAALLRTIKKLQIARIGMDRRHVQSLVEYQFSKSTLEALYLEATNPSKREQLTFVIPALKELVRLPNLSEKFSNQCNILIVVLAAGNASEGIPALAMAKYFNPHTAGLISSVRQGADRHCEEGQGVDQHQLRDVREQAREGGLLLEDEGEREREFVQDDLMETAVFSS